MSLAPEARALVPALLAVALLLVRMLSTGRESYVFLAPNLVLAAVPALLALVAEHLDRNRAPRAALLVLVPWLLFLPNAPYVLTDFVHLHDRPPVPLWYDVALLGAASVAGFALGAASLARVHALLTRRFGAVRALGAVLVACGLSGYGIYLGRFVRLNSWDVALAPGLVAREVLVPLLAPDAHLRAWTVTVVFGALTAASFAVHTTRTGRTA